MKTYRLISFLGLIVLLLAFWNCSETSKNTDPNFSTENPIFSLYPVVSPNNFLIYPNNEVKDIHGNLIGFFDEKGNVLDETGAVLEIGIDKSELFILTPIGFIINPEGAVTTHEGEVVGKVNEFGFIVLLDGTVIDGNGQVPPPPVSSSSEEILPPASSSSNPVVITPSSSSKVVVPSSSSKVVVPSSSSKVVVPSSSSVVVKPSSSSTQQTNVCPTIKIKNGGKSGSGYASRYWDCCKPHCAWRENTGNVTKTCDANNKEINPDGASFCDGGNVGTCVSQAPFAVCDDVAYGFAAVPAALGGECGKCFVLTFTGEGKYAKDATQSALKGKKMVVMVSNIGGDVGDGQFDLMIPGGGVGLFNGCGAAMGINNFGETYGGLLSSCEKEVNYDASKYKSCLTNKCNNTFGSNPKHSEALAGCLFLANWMKAAGNPKHNYQEVECPRELMDRY